MLAGVSALSVTVYVRATAVVTVIAAGVAGEGAVGGVKDQPARDERGRRQGVGQLADAGAGGGWRQGQGGDGCAGGVGLVGNVGGVKHQGADLITPLEVLIRRPRCSGLAPESSWVLRADNNFIRTIRPPRQPNSGIAICGLRPLLVRGGEAVAVSVQRRHCGIDKIYVKRHQNRSRPEFVGEDYQSRSRFQRHTGELNQRVDIPARHHAANGHRPCGIRIMRD